MWRKYPTFPKIGCEDTADAWEEGWKSSAEAEGEVPAALKKWKDVRVRSSFERYKISANYG